MNVLNTSSISDKAQWEPVSHQKESTNRGANSGSPAPYVRKEGGTGDGDRDVRNVSKGEAWSEDKKKKERRGSGLKDQRD